MKRKIYIAIAVLCMLAVFSVSCSKNEQVEGTTEPAATGDVISVDVDSETETSTELESETESATETETEKATETEKETQKETSKETEKETAKETQNQAQSSGNSEIGGGGAIGGSVVSKPSDGQNDSGSSNTDSTTVPEGYIKTANGDLIVKTVSDRSVDSSEDNSTSIPYERIKSSTVATDPNADYNKVKLKLEHMKPGVMVQGVLIGYDGYMFYKDTLSDFVGDGFLNVSVYNRVVEDMKERNDWAESTGRKFYYVIAPNKNSIYPDYMPSGYELAEYRRYDQFVELLTDAGITAVDLRDALTEEVEKNPKKNLYYRYDTHWNNHAGYISYRATMDIIKKDFPNVVIHDKSEYQINYCETYMKDMAYYLGQYDALKDYGPVYTLKSGKTARLDYKSSQVKGGQYTFAHVHADGYSDKLVYFRYVNDYNKNAPNIYVMRDSYSIALVPFFKDSFYKSTYNWTWAFEEDKIEAADADIVMVVVAERNLRNCVNEKAVVD